MPRLHCPLPLAPGQSLALPPGAARHVQVLRLQPGDALTLFNGDGGEWRATVERMGRSDVQVLVGAHDPIEREAPRAVHLALGMPANDRMDWLVEKATELGVASIQPLVTAHSVLRLSGERADKKQSHWQSVAVAACEQCGRNRVQVVHPVSSLEGWLGTASIAATRLLLSPGKDARALQPTGGGPFVVLSGPEGGLSATEEAVAVAAGFARVSLGPRILRAETAPLATVALLTLQA